LADITTFGNYFVVQPKCVKWLNNAEEAFNNREVPIAEKAIFELPKTVHCPRDYPINVVQSGVEDEVFTAEEIFKKLCASPGYGITPAQSTALFWDDAGKTNFEAWLIHGGWDIGGTHAKPPAK
jgi:hypothetical protein